MKKNTLHIAVRSFMTVVVIGLSMVFASCKYDNKEEKKEEPVPVITVVDSIPSNILPREIYDEVASRINIYKGDTPPALSGQFLSKPHALLYASYDPTYNPEDSTVFFSDRYIAFTYSSVNGMDYYGKQWDTDHGVWVEEHVQQMRITGENDNFCCFYAVEGWPNGIYLRQSTIFSGTLTSAGIKDFKVAVIMVENDGNEEYFDKNTFRILGDFDGLAENNNWMGKKSLEPARGQADSFMK